MIEVYAKWISSVDDRLEMAKVDTAIKQQFKINPKGRKAQKKDE